ncbi:vanillate O-demethylase monooxygenase subunit [Actinocorallia herbida]|uniref:Vanillate O-demethylase monooxygenase subunit n=1 Tax=Actinocorallia herbida TaxID=58109 RepID=A0A3N1CUX2_9ACTN|nr:aromatic ring-hydroxylating dioxygenase subunit alpha [Actinocorallia herbida]ROO85024.1 vanillate O-demethylase monooxygenase subunit [Actinocorallia herbida]
MQRFADNTTPLLRDHWYVAALASELTAEPLERQILERSVLLMRASDGAPVALSNRCPHRSFPLSRGRVENDVITCGYHGIRFRTDGSCAEVPSQDSVPSALRLHAYPVVEAGPFVWIWTGDPAAARTADLPATPWLTSADFATVADYFFVESAYLRMHENVMDLTHLPFLHGTVFRSLEFARARPEVEAVGMKVRSSLTMPSGSMPPYLAKLVGSGAPASVRHTDAWFDGPALHYALARYSLAEPEADGRVDFLVNFLHAFTPATKTSTHYFWAVSRDAAVGDAAVDEECRATQRYVFHQDVEGMRWVEDLCGQEGGTPEELSVAADRPGLLLRRHVALMAAEEAAPAPQPVG